MRLPVRTVIYFYIFICIVLLVFNLLYIFRSSSVKRRQQRRIKNWSKYLDSFEEGTPVWDSDELLRRMKNIQELMAFHAAIEVKNQALPVAATVFFRMNHSTILELAKQYGKKPAMEQAFFAYVIAAFYPPVGDQRTPLLEILLSYLDNSTVYSRENVLGALYALGNIQAVEHAFILMSQRGWYHDSRLLSDGLNRFQGEKETLANRLWDSRKQLAECFQVGTIRFAEMLNGDGFAEVFLRALETEQLPTETQFTLVRYFRHHAVPYAKQMLLQLLNEDTGGKQGLAIVAASSLVSYPDSETQQALKDALRSHNWYVRRNAAQSLKALGVTWEEAQIDLDGDRYGTEMLKYILGVQPDTVEEGKERKVLAAV